MVLDQKEIPNKSRTQQLETKLKTRNFIIEINHNITNKTFWRANDGDVIAPSKFNLLRLNPIPTIYHASKIMYSDYTNIITPFRVHSLYDFRNHNRGKDYWSSPETSFYYTEETNRIFKIRKWLDYTFNVAVNEYDKSNIFKNFNQVRPYEIRSSIRSFINEKMETFIENNTLKNFYGFAFYRLETNRDQYGMPIDTFLQDYPVSSNDFVRNFYIIAVKTRSAAMLLPFTFPGVKIHKFDFPKELFP